MRVAATDCQSHYSLLYARFVCAITFQPLLPILMTAVLILFALAGCSSPNDSENRVVDDPPTSTSSSDYRALTVDEFADILANRAEEYTIVNVHIPYEGEIEGTDANIPYNDLATLTSALPDRDAPIILYCRSGSMSRQASSALLELGYTQIWDVTGGMNAWSASGRTLVNNPSQSD